MNLTTEHWTCWSTNVPFSHFQCLSVVNKGKLCEESLAYLKTVVNTVYCADCTELNLLQILFSVQLSVSFHSCLQQQNYPFTIAYVSFYKTHYQFSVQKAIDNETGSSEITKILYINVFSTVCYNKTHSMAAVSLIMYVTSVWSCIYCFQGRSFVHVPLFM